MNSVEDILLSFNYLDSCQQISNLKISYRFVVNSRVCIQDELRDTNLFSVGYSFKYLLEEGNPGGRFAAGSVQKKS